MRLIPIWADWPAALGCRLRVLFLLSIATLTYARTHLSQSQGVQGSKAQRLMVFRLLDAETGSPIAAIEEMLAVHFMLEGNAR